MTFIALLLLLVVVGMLLPILPIDDRVRRIIIAIVAILALAWVLGLLLGVVHISGPVRIAG